MLNNSLSPAGLAAAVLVIVAGGKLLPGSSESTSPKRVWIQNTLRNLPAGTFEDGGANLDTRRYGTGCLSSIHDAGQPRRAQRLDIKAGEKLGSRPKWEFRGVSSMGEFEHSRRQAELSNFDPICPQSRHRTGLEPSPAE